MEKKTETKIMKKESKKIDGPSCACGKVDLYEEMLKQQESSKTEQVDKTKAKKANVPIIPAADSDKKEKKSV